MVPLAGSRARTRRQAKWAADGIRWDALTVDKGTLRFLIAGSAPGVLEIHADDTVRTKRLQGRLAAAGSRAWLVGREGTVQETLDAGKSFHEIVPPPGGAPQKGLARCVATGCTLGPWHRVGWGPD